MHHFNFLILLNSNTLTFFQSFTRVYDFFRLGVAWFMERISPCVETLMRSERFIFSIHSFLQGIICKCKNATAFLQAWIKNPLAIGAVAPSSSFLAKEMASHVFNKPPGIIVELGAGTGVVTSALLDSGIQPENLVILERSSVMVSRIRKQFPQVCVLEGDAVDLQNLLAGEARQINTVVSGLPLRALSREAIEMILKQIAELLGSGGKYIQFTYGIQQKAGWFQKYFRLIHSKRVWYNLPPARVDVYEVAKIEG